MNLKNQDGLLLINAVITLAISSILLAIAVPKLGQLLSAAKVTATKAEMTNIQIAAAMHGATPSNLNQLSSYFNGNGFKKDEFGVNYTYDNLTGELCSVSINYCIFL